MLGLFTVGLSVVHLALPALTAADLVVLNAKIWTVNRAQPEVEALAVVHDRLVAVGTSAEMRQMIGPQTRVVDAQGHRR